MDIWRTFRLSIKPEIYDTITMNEVLISYMIVISIKYPIPN